MKAMQSSQNRYRETILQRQEDSEKSRRFLLSFSSEEPYRRYFGMEILDHSPGCVNLDRLNTIGCVLFNHDRDKPIGKILRAWIENGRGNAEIEFDSDNFSETIFQKVLSGSLKGVSVGYRVGRFEDVNAGAISSDGRFNGPCSIAKDWTPFEISIVTVPADATVGVGRSLFSPIALLESQLRVNKNYFNRRANNE